MRPQTIVGAVVALALLVAPFVVGGFFVDFVLTRTLIFGVAAATVVFLTGYGGMASLAQLTIFGVAGFMIANASVSEVGARGLALGWNVWISVVFAVVVSTIVAFVIGAISSRTSGIYFLMLTFIFAVIGFLIFGQVIPLSGFGGITGVDPPGFLDDEPTRLYYVAVALSAFAFFGLRWLGSTPFGLVLQGIRDEPIRMAALGVNVALHRALAFTAAGFIAALAGILHVWWNGQIDPTSIGVGPTIDLLIIAVLGGIARLEGAWLGSFIFVAANIYLRDLPLIDQIGITEDRFNTVVGALVLLVVVISPDGIIGILDRFKRPKEPLPPTAVVAGEQPIA